MTAVATAGAASRETVDWHAIDWQRAHQNVRRLQARIVKATQAGRWGKVKALQRLLTRSFSQTSDREPRQTDTRRRQRNLEHAPKESTRNSGASATRLPLSTAQARVSGEAERKEAPSRHSLHDRSRHASALPARARPNCRNDRRSKLIQLPTRAIDGRCDRAMSPGAWQTNLSTVDLGGRYTLVLRHRAPVRVPNDWAVNSLRVWWRHPFLTPPVLLAASSRGRG